jgi:hypothetical protein
MVSEKICGCLGYLFKYIEKLAYPQKNFQTIEPHHIVGMDGLPIDPSQLRSTTLPKCDNCSNRHSTCDRNEPCGTCLKLRRTCSYRQRRSPCGPCQAHHLGCDGKVPACGNCQRHGRYCSFSQQDDSHCPDCGCFLRSGRVCAWHNLDWTDGDGFVLFEVPKSFGASEEEEYPETYLDDSTQDVFPLGTSDKFIMFL